MINVECLYCRSFIRTIDDGDPPRTLVSHGVCDKCLPTLVSDLGQSFGEFLDSCAVPILVVEADMRVIGANVAARALVSDSMPEIEGRLSGDVIGCKHASEPGGCGRTIHCQSCTIRRAAMETLKTGIPHFRMPAFADIGVITGDERVKFLISTERRKDMVLLRIEPETIPSSNPTGSETTSEGFQA
ncbi:MAG: hypothetical protein HZB26_13335 [Candidatus Hydrogenedentes bacterium]|nr:hypothetical protein [Candidatus Hydrogenedentota bacterium]